MPNWLWDSPKIFKLSTNLPSKQERECIIDDTKNILSTSGPDNDLSAHRSDPNFDAGVAILSKLSGQNLIKLREEHPIGDEL